jgi:hypothetical protein
MTLVKALEQFNRKERYWLLRDCLGEQYLCPNFREKLSQTLGGLDIPHNAWWAIDYHWDWLFGAITRLANETGAIPNHPKANENQKLIDGNQQDVDLIVAFNKTIILVEAKVDTSWSNEQYKSKCGRFKIFENFLSQRQDTLPEKIDAHFLLTSPRKSKNLEADHVWFQLLSFKPEEHVRIVRCDGNQKPTKTGKYFSVEK